MTVLDVQFPTNISYGSSGGPGFLTRIISTQAGFEYRSGAWARSRAKYDASHGLKTPSDYKQLINFFYGVAFGRLNAWRYKDWLDYTDWGQGVVRSNLAGHLQLAKEYTLSGGSTYRRFIDKPVSATVTITGRPSATVNYTNGLVTGGGVTAGDAWTGQFDVPCRFDIDDLDMAIEQPSGSAGTEMAPSWRHIPIIEVRVTPP